MYVSVNTVVCNYLLCILELPLRKHVFCYLARGSKTYATNKYLSIYLSTKKQPLFFKNFEVLANAEGNFKAKSK